MHLSGSPLDYLLAFFGGILISLTPCVYPLIPITAGYIGINSASSKKKGLFLSLAYVTGMALTFSALGLFASLTGKIFGLISSHPITYIIVGVVIFLFGLAMLDVFPLILPNFIRLPKSKKGGYFPAFILGLASGLIVGPCLTPALGAILAYLATKQNILYGASLLFVFAYGMGVIFILIGTFSGLFLRIPKLNKWMVYIKKFIGVIIIITGIYFIFTGIGRI